MKEREGKAISEGKRGEDKRSLLILVALASYLYQLGHAKRKCEET